MRQRTRSEADLKYKGRSRQARSICDELFSRCWSVELGCSATFYVPRAVPSIKTVSKYSTSVYSFQSVKELHMSCNDSVHSWNSIPKPMQGCWFVHIRSRPTNRSCRWDVRYSPQVRCSESTKHCEDRDYQC